MRLGEPGVEEEVIGWLRTVSGVTVQFHDALLLPHAPTTIELFGANGSLLARPCGVGDEAQLWLTRANVKTAQPLEPVNPHRAALSRFVGAVRGSGAAHCNGK